MGALTSNRKRGDEYFSPYQNAPDFHRSKKPKFSLSSMHQSPGKPVISSNSTISRISRYPETKPPLRREVHAPVRTLKFGFSRLKATSFSKKIEKEEVLDHEMGNFLSTNYKDAKRTAFGALRFLVKDKEVVDVDNGRNADKAEEVILSDDDSSVEEVEIIEKGGRGRQSNVGDHDVVKVVEEPNFLPSSSSVVTDATEKGNLRVEDSRKMLVSLSLGRNVDVSSVEAYKKLLESAERRDSKLKALDFEIQLNEKKRASHQLLRPVKKPADPVVEIPREPFVLLTEEEEAEVKDAFSNRKKASVLVTHQKSGIDITGQILQCLRPAQWLNDEVINVYLELLKERENREPKKFLKCHFFNTFFYNKLKSGGFKAVKRWTSIKKLGYYLIDCEKIFVPIHRQIHWCLAIINAKDQKFQYLDSLKGRDPEVLKSLAAYYVEEVKDKSGKVIDVSSWEREFVEDLPEQENGFDCGMFMLKYADFYSRGLGLCFDQAHMPYFRLRTAKEILRLRAD